jgi:predicted ATPase/class 3 adenylate cyclase
VNARALIFTDIVDSTRIAELLGDARNAEVWIEHDRRARDLLARYRGLELGRTDGVVALFDAPADAARFALDYHAALADLPIRARAALHVGPVTLRANAPDDVARGAPAREVEGLATSIAARVLTLAGAGQTLVSRPGRDAIEDSTPRSFKLEPHGHYRFKGLSELIEIFELGQADRAAFAPPRDVDKAYRVVRRGDVWVPAREVRHNLPAERDGFVGRVAELDALAAMLDRGTRLVTVVGPGGGGKTRFVLRYGWTWLGEWSGGVHFADLSEARTLDGIFYAIASALGVALGRDDPAVQLGHATGSRGRCLVIVDNFEQVISHARETIGRWLDAAPDATFVVTSRERLHLPGEQVLPLEPLPLDVEAVELFELRARAQRPGFTVNDDNRRDVREIVRMLDGLPLAIELAAARIRIMSPARLVERLRDRFKLLAGARGASGRQATLRRAIDWSWDLLEPWEQAALAQCSIFEGGFTLEAAEAVLDLTEWPEAAPVMDVVQALVDKCLLRTWFPSGRRRHDIDEPYFGMYISIHEYASEKLHAMGPDRSLATERRHGEYFARHGSDEAIESLHVFGGIERRRELALDIDNLVAACRRAARRNDAEVAVSTYRAAAEVFDLQGPFRLAVELGAAMLALPGADAPQRGIVLLASGRAVRRIGRTDDAASQVEAALTAARESGREVDETTALLALGILRHEQGRSTEGLGLLKAGIALAQRIGHRRLEGDGLDKLGCIDAPQGRLDEARTSFESALAIQREIGDRRAEAIATLHLGNISREFGRLDDAAALYEKARDIGREIGSRRDESSASRAMALILLDQKRVDEAQALCEAALAINREVGLRSEEGSILELQAGALSDSGRLEEALPRYAQALNLHRELGNRHREGVTLAGFGDALARRGRLSEARRAFRDGEALLRETGDRMMLAVLLSLSGQAEVAAGDRDAALRAHAAALDAAGGMGPDSFPMLYVNDLGRTLDGAPRSL